MAVRGVDPNEEKKSYGAVFFVGSILLVVVSLWAVFDDNITRRVWKIHQTEFLQTDYERAAGPRWPRSSSAWTRIRSTRTW